MTEDPLLIAGLRRVSKLSRSAARFSEEARKGLLGSTTTRRQVRQARVQLEAASRELYAVEAKLGGLQGSDR